VIAVSHGRQVGCGEGTVVQRRPDESCIDSHLDQVLKLPHRCDATSGEQLHIRVDTAECSQQRYVGALSAPDPRQVEHQQPRGPSRDRRARQVDRRPAPLGDAERLAVSQVEGKDHPGGTHRADHGREGVERGQRLEPHDHLVHAIGEQIPGPRRGRDARVDEQAATQRREIPQRLTLHGPPGEGIEIGDVAFIAPEGIAIRGHQGSRVTRRGDESGANGRIRFAPAAAPRNRPSAGEVEHRNYLHRGAPDRHRA